MNIIEIPYSALVSVPLLMHESHTVTTAELLEYKTLIATHAAFKGQRITFENKDAKTFFEITRHSWLDIKPIENGETEYTIKLGLENGPKQEISSIDKSVFELLSSPAALKVFDKGYSKSLTDKRPQ